MRRGTLGIYDRETEFGKRLGEFIRKYTGNDIEVRIFTRREVLLDAVKKGILDVVILGEKSGNHRDLSSEPEDHGLAAELHRYKNLPIIILCEDLKQGHGQEKNQESNPDMLQNRFYVERYQAAEAIWKQIMLFSGEHLSSGVGQISSGRKPEVIGILQMPGGNPTGDRERIWECGYDFARSYAEENKEHALFISLEEFSDLEQRLHSEVRGMTGDISELYYFYSQKELTKSRLQASVYRRGYLDCILPVRFPEDLYPEGRLYETGFFEELFRIADYGALFLNLGESVREKEALLRLCDKLWIPGLKIRDGEMDRNRFYRWLKDRGLENRIVTMVKGDDES